MVYCNEHPEDEIANSEPPADKSFARDLDKQITLACKRGYVAVGNMVVTCGPQTPSDGKWNANSECNCKLIAVSR